MKGFKVVAQDKTHHGFVYQEGLNIDPNPFRSKGTCVSGGLYFFTDIKDVVSFLGYGVYLYAVEVPNGRRYVKDPAGDKYRSKYLILKEFKDLSLTTTWEYLIQQGVDIHSYFENPLRWAAYYGYLDVVKFLVARGACIHVKEGEALYYAETRGHVKVAKFLRSEGAGREPYLFNAFCRSTLK